MGGIRFACGACDCVAFYGERRWRAAAFLGVEKMDESQPFWKHENFPFIAGGVIAIAFISLMAWAVVNRPTQPRIESIHNSGTVNVYYDAEFGIRCYFFRNVSTSLSCVKVEP